MNKKIAVMFSHITWASYIQTVCLLLLLYYAFVLYKYYSNDLLYLIKQKQNDSTNKFAFPSTRHEPDVSNSSPGDHQQYMAHEDSDTGSLGLFQALTDEVQAFIAEAGNNKFDKDQILPSLSLLLSKYPSIKSSPYRHRIENIIAQKCELNCSVHLSKCELDRLWVQ